MWDIDQSSLRLKLRGMGRPSRWSGNWIGILMVASSCLATACVAQQSQPQPEV
jgi:hypothetical protein